jgi:hypothetical protein
VLGRWHSAPGFACLTIQCWTRHYNELVPNLFCLLPGSATTAEQIVTEGEALGGTIGLNWLGTLLSCCASSWQIRGHITDDLHLMPSSPHPFDTSACYKPHFVIWSDEGMPSNSYRSRETDTWPKRDVPPETFQNTLLLCCPSHSSSSPQLHS